jgi:hypothetical protein
MVTNTKKCNFSVLNFYVVESRTYELRYICALECEECAYTLEDMRNI